MKRFAIGLALLLASAVVTPAQAASIEFANDLNSEIVFAGDSTFTFDGNAVITDTDALPASLVGLDVFIDGVFTIGAGALSAPVTDVGGVFRIDDGAGFDFTADLDWVTISQLGTGGSLNTFGAINLTNFAYAGANADLLLLLNNYVDGIVTASFQFTTTRTLDDLRTQEIANSYSGTAEFNEEAVPEPVSMLLFGAGLAGLAIRKRRSASVQ